MPKIVTRPKLKLNARAAGLPDEESLRRYVTVPYPESLVAIEQEVSGVLNLQACTCAHDRCCHSRYVGEGEEQRLVVGAFNVGKCLVRGCRCGAFVFSHAVSSAEGKKRRQREKGLTKDYPPEEK